MNASAAADSEVVRTTTIHIVWHGENWYKGPFTTVYGDSDTFDDAPNDDTYKDSGNPNCTAATVHTLGRPTYTRDQMEFYRAWPNDETEPFRLVEIEWQPQLEWEIFPYQVCQYRQRLRCPYACPAAGKYHRGEKCRPLMLATAARLRRRNVDSEVSLSWYGPARGS